jgi:membrane-associated protease RseP (regulator of RpoE activity)
MTLVGWIIFIFALLFSIMLHEFGHFATAKKFRMKVTQFFVGFGQTLWSTVRGETEYGVKAIPAGGYVKIVGMTALEDVDPEDEPRSFRRKPPWQRMIVLAAGSFMHFALAFVLLFILAGGIGLSNTNSSTIGAIDPCVPNSITATSCAKSDPASPALKAGLRTNDKIIAIGHTRVHNWNQLGAAIRAQKPGTPVTVTVLRNGHQVVLHPSLAVVHGRKGSYLGISPAVLYSTVNPIRAVTYAGSEFGQIVVGSVQALGHSRAVREEPEQHRGRQRDQRGRRRGVHRRGVRGQGRLADQGLDRAVHRHLAEHLRRPVQPAAVAPAGRRPPGRGHLRADPDLDRPAPAPARPGAGRHAQAPPAQCRGIRGAGRVRPAADHGGPREPRPHTPVR